MVVWVWKVVGEREDILEILMIECVMKGRNIKDNSDFWLDYWVGGSTPPPDMGKQRNMRLGMGEEFCFSPLNLEMANLPKVTEMVAIGFKASFI